MFGVSCLSHLTRLPEILSSHTNSFASASQESWHDWAHPWTRSHTLLQEQRFVCNLTQPGVAQKTVLANSSMSATEKGVKGSTQLASAPQSTSLLKYIITPYNAFILRKSYGTTQTQVRYKNYLLELITVFPLDTADRDASTSHEI